MIQRPQQHIIFVIGAYFGKVRSDVRIYPPKFGCLEWVLFNDFKHEIEFTATNQMAFGASSLIMCRMILGSV
jgi:hypothetical protein